MYRQTLFILYTSDLTRLRLRVYLYADDTQVYNFSSSSSTDVGLYWHYWLSSN